MPADNRITAGYNFVPLAEFVYEPPDADRISMDVPFSDGISGTIECELQTVTPLFVGAEKPRVANPQNERAVEKPFFMVDGRPAIPGSSLRGMLRNVIEIASFGRIGPRIDNTRYGFRDLKMKSYKDELVGRVRAGWLKRQSGGWVLIPASFARVTHDELNRYAGNEVFDGHRCSAEEIYKKFRPSLDVKFDWNKFGRNKSDRNAGRDVTLGAGPHKGTLVFTGNTGVSDERARKKREFVFYGENAEPVDVPRDVMQDFEFIHANDDGTPRDEWRYWRAQLDQGTTDRIPVFYLPSADGKPTSLGLAYMYRLAYKHRVHELTPKAHRLASTLPLDLADCLFGRIDDKDSLRGRVTIGLALPGADVGQDENPVVGVLGAPKPTYYPNYIDQEGVRDVDPYQTFMDRHARLKGWKRYPARSGTSSLPPVPDRGGDGGKNWNVAVSFRPVKGTFTFTVRVHNLRPFELGALFWALTWGDDERLVHSLGMAKGFGYGQVKIRLKSTRLRAVTGGAEPTVKDCIAAFTSRMDAAVRGVWKDSFQIQNLLASADPSTRTPEHHAYQVLDQRAGRNDFQKAKRNRWALPYLVDPGPSERRGRVSSTPSPPRVPEWVSRDDQWDKLSARLQHEFRTETMNPNAQTLVKFMGMINSQRFEKVTEDAEKAALARITLDLYEKLLQPLLAKDKKKRKRFEEGYTEFLENLKTLAPK